ncbi:hemerythrin domain-containing protein [Azospirillum picis]|uniref:Hemerythrin superfamily protein n=1 Tax=Azospirillum picis TaxID=488438 RepID=A0ABU0MJE1_9PROT|nr:hemerythrin domain-containing protein [Azospirillum picis]MBP2299793.1 hemerythrin superfamily protein [Azospirillum picis]MDQ0533589.1 hemerythrin superfamily protein [Azospirillum picis]
MARYRSDGSADWLSARGLAMMAGGAVLALAASRLLPPVVAQMAGSARAASGRDAFDALVDDHRNIQALLSEMVQTPIDSTVRRTQLLLRLKRRLAAHAMAEEDVVYPMLHDQAHKEEDAKHLYGEHAEIKMHLFTLERMPKDDPRWLAVAHDLKRIVDGHIRQEEEIDFPALRNSLDQRETAVMSGSVAREKALIL